MYKSSAGKNGEHGKLFNQKVNIKNSNLTKRGLRKMLTYFINLISTSRSNTKNKISIVRLMIHHLKTGNNFLSARFAKVAFF